MASESRRSDAPLIEALSAEPERFDLLQAVRVLERVAALEAREGGRERPVAVGGDADPRAEAVQLRAALELAFPASEISGLDASGARPSLSVAAMGLQGPAGVLPSYYSEMVLEALRSRNLAMRDFLDLLNHRAISLFVRASEKYRIEAGFARSDGQPDAIGAVLLALIGLGDPSLRDRTSAPDTVLAYYAGLYAHHPRTAEALGQILSDYFGRPARIIQFLGLWSELPPQERTRLDGGERGAFSQLGVDAICGSRVYDVQSRFRVSLGPVSYRQFQEFLPGSPQLAQLVDLVRTYVGPALEFDVQLILRGEEVPPLRLSSGPGPGPQLGWNTWLPTRGGRADADEAVFAVVGD